MTLCSGWPLGLSLTSAYKQLEHTAGEYLGGVVSNNTYRGLRPLLARCALAIRFGYHDGNRKEKHDGFQ